MIHRFCISHKKPLLPESWYDDCIALGDFQPDSPLHVSQLDQFWHEARPLAYGAAGTPVLPIAIERLSSAPNLIEISSCRKRLFPSRVGIEAQAYPTMRELSIGNRREEDELSVFTPRDDLEFLVAQPIYFRNGIIGQYAAGHHRRDILDYTSLAVEMDVLDSDSRSELLAAKHFIPGGTELGIFPKSWLMHVLPEIERVGRHFLNRYGDRLKKYNAHQIRAVGFLSERLGSFLLIRHLMDKYANNIPADIFGYMAVIVEGNSSYSHALGDEPRNRSKWYRRKSSRAR